MGMQVLRILSADAAYKTRSILSDAFAKSDQVSEHAHKLRRDGYLIVPNFLSDSDFAAVRSEYDAAMERHKDGSSSIDSVGIVNVKVRKLDWAAECPSINRLIFHSDRIDGIVARAQGWSPDKFSKGIRRGFQLFRSYMADNPDAHKTDELDGSSTNYHSDTYFRLFKAFFFVSDVTERTAATRVCRGTNRISPSRLRFEYENSVNRDRGSSFVPLDRYSQIASDVMHLEAPRNSLALLDTFTIHGRGVFDNKQAVRDLIEVHYFSKPYTV
jgi:hypothetical protein